IYTNLHESNPNSSRQEGQETKSAKKKILLGFSWRSWLLGGLGPRFCIAFDSCRFVSIRAIRGSPVFLALPYFTSLSLYSTPCGSARRAPALFPWLQGVCPSFLLFSAGHCPATRRLGARRGWLWLPRFR